MSESPAAFAPSGIVTLTTDFGLRDPFVGVMKGQMLLRHPPLQIVDMTHEILAHWPAEAGFWLARSHAYFPRGTVHVAVVDPGVGSARGVLVVERAGHVFLAPDNGLLADVIELEGTVIVRKLTAAASAELRLGAPSATFHGRDVFAPIAAELACGRVPPARLGPTTSEWVPGWLDPPQVAGDQITGQIVTIDHFGNLITNIAAAQLPQVPHPMVHIGGHSILLRRTYSDVRPGDYLALVNSFGVLEIARAEQSAAEGLGLARGAPVAVSAKGV
jgi:S-adenosylmethionine hydrolase